MFIVSVKNNGEKKNESHQASKQLRMRGAKLKAIKFKLLLK